MSDLLYYLLKEGKIMTSDFVIILLEELIKLGAIASYKVFGDHITVIIKK